MGGDDGFVRWIQSGCNPTDLKLVEGAEEPTYFHLVPMSYRQRMHHQQMQHSASPLDRAIYATRCSLRKVENFRDEDEKGNVRTIDQPVVENTPDHGQMVSQAWLERVEFPVEFYPAIEGVVLLVSQPLAPLSKGSGLPSGATGSM